MQNERIEKAAQEIARLLRVCFEPHEFLPSREPCSFGIGHRKITRDTLMTEAVAILGLPMDPGDSDTIDLLRGPVADLLIGDDDVFWQDALTEESVVLWKQALHRALSINQERAALVKTIEAAMDKPGCTGHHAALMALAGHLGANDEMARLQAAETLRRQEASLNDDFDTRNAEWIRRDVQRILIEFHLDESLAEDVRALLP